MEYGTDAGQGDLVTLFDFIAAVILLVSGVVGFVRGAAREVLTVVAFILAVVVAVLGLRFTGPIAREAIHPGVLANTIAILVVFAAAYILFRVLGSGLTRTIHAAEPLGVLDRVIGVGFGLVRALVLLGVFYLVFNAATPAERAPSWIKDAKLYPLASASGRLLMTLAPEGSKVASKVAPVLEKAVKDGATDQSKLPASDNGAGYDAQSRKTVDELVEKSR
jgi:membrane protein required for colicin V production